MPQQKEGFLSISHAVVIFFENFAAQFPEKELGQTAGSMSERVAVDFGAGLGARVHGRYPRGSRPWEERRGQHPNRCNSHNLPCCRTCGALTRSAACIIRSTFSRGGVATLQAPGSRRQSKWNVAWTRQRRAFNSEGSLLPGRPSLRSSSSAAESRSAYSAVSAAKAGLAKAAS